MRRGRNPGDGQGSSAHSSRINRIIENLEYFASLRESSQAVGAQVTAFSQARAGALTPADWKAADGSHGRLIVSLVGAHGWAARVLAAWALELDIEHMDALDVFVGTQNLADTLVNLMPAEERKLLALAFIRADTLSLHARLLARVARGSADGDGSNGSGGSGGGSSGSGDSGGSGTGRGATSAAMTAAQRAAAMIRVQLLVLNAASSVLRMLLSCHDAVIELRAALLRTQLFEHISAALLSAAAAIATGALTNMDANWGSLLTCASIVGSCINLLIQGMAEEEDYKKQETPQWQPETVGGGAPAPRQFLIQVIELEMVRQLLGGRCLQACAVWMTRVAEATLREGSAAGSAAAPGQAGVQDPAAQALGSGHGAAGSGAAAAAAAATTAAPDAGGSRAPQRLRPEAAGDAVAVCRALVRPAVPLTLVTQNTHTYITPAAVALAISARDCPLLLALTPPLRWGAKMDGANTGAVLGAGGVCAQQQQQQGPCTPDAIAGAAAASPAGAGAAAVAASAQLPAPSGPKAAAVERTRAVNTYDVLYGAVDAMCAGRNTNMDLQDEKATTSMRQPVTLLVRLLCKLRPRQAAARLAGLWRVLLCELEVARFMYVVAAEVGLLLRLQLEEDPRGSTTAVALVSVSSAAYAAPAAVAVAPHSAEHAFTPSFSLRCALAAGLLPRLEALLRNPQAWPEAYATGGSSDRVLWPLLVDSGVWPLVLAHAPAAQVASLVATLTAAVRRLRHGHRSQAAAAEGRSGGRTIGGSSSRGGDTTGSSTSGDGGASSSAAPAPGTHAAGADINGPDMEAWRLGFGCLAGRLTTLLRQSVHARMQVFKVDGGALETPGSQAQALAQGQLEQAQEAKTAAVGAAGGPCLRPSAYAPAAEQQRLLMSLCLWQWLPQFLFLAGSYPLDREDVWQSMQAVTAHQLTVAVLHALRAEQHAAGAAGGADGADSSSSSSSLGGNSGTLNSTSGSTGCCVIPAAQAAESWRAFLHSQELDAEGFLAALLRHIGNPNRCIDKYWVAFLLIAIGAWDPEMLVRAATAAAAVDGGSSSSGSSSISAAAVVSGARTLVEHVQQKEDKLSGWPLPELFDFVAAAVEQPSPAPGAGGVGTERRAAERLQLNRWRELQAAALAAGAEYTTVVNLMSPAEVQARLRRLPVPVATAAASDATAGSSTTGAAATAAGTAEAGSERGVVLCGNPACANTDGPSALFPASGGKTCARCKAVWYCCGACQLAHWQQQGGHREACSKAQAQAQGQGRAQAQGQGQAQAQGQGHAARRRGRRRRRGRGRGGRRRKGTRRGGRPQL
ncbi:hypothetical protein CHLRE_14g627788v5 [Chlamydomonas reinhardtii]|uniref:phytol kinase n=1 Tax=Chlamydomonas reinhardtii TaxID=3055 RepID=A0A2K3CYG4_CHLRE|nr:uncharacterized protein CHLRE_14g627788v5 [Chlamydomonas reinhardtii]PNW73323.1 hypothetical protein CHLRE_14g627788v5 [Chlamydomonas reinhardtii]